MPWGSCAWADIARQAAAIAHFKATTLTTWADAAGTRWLLAADETEQSGFIQAYKLVTGDDGRSVLQPAWRSKAMNAPGKTMVIDGVVFALATEQDRGAAKILSGRPATVYALDAATGHELWNSGASITTFVSTSALSFSPGQIYVGTNDGTLYAFGFPEPRQ